MVLEYLYPLKLIQRNPFYAFLLGVGYSIIGIGTAIILFPDDPAIVSIAFIALMFYPTINSLMKEEEMIEAENKETSFVSFFRDHQDILKVYAFAFLGVLLAYSFFSMILPSLAANYIFKSQLNVLYGLVGRGGSIGATGAAFFNLALLQNLLSNNFSVLILAFVTAFLLGDGAIFLLTWNASVWGTIFGTIAKNAAVKGGTASWAVCSNPANCYLWIMLIVFAHMIIEAFAYMCAATAGGTISKALLKEELFSTRFGNLFMNTLLLIVFALIVLVIGGLVETFVLVNSDTYRIIIQQSFL